MLPNIRTLLVANGPAREHLLGSYFAEAAFDGFQLERADSVEEAICRLRQASFALILLELSASGADSLHALRAILHSAPHSPVVVIANRDQEKLARRAVARGARDYLLKDDAGQRLTVRFLRNIAADHGASREASIHRSEYRALTYARSLAAAKERDQLAETLHNTVAQSLSLVRHKLDQIAQSADSAERAERIDAARTLVEDTLRATRLLILDIGPPLLHEIGFQPALGWLVDRFASESDLAWHVSFDIPPLLLHEELSRILFHVVRELMTNVVRHAMARRASLTVRHDRQSLTIILEDDGVGFDPALLARRVTRSGGTGLFHARELIEQLDGRLEIQTGGRTGTRILLTLPFASGDGTTRIREERVHAHQNPSRRRPRALLSGDSGALQR